MGQSFLIRRKLLAVSCFLLSIGFFSSCSKDDDNNTQPNIAGFMAFNLAPDQPLIGISLSGNHLNTPLPYISYTGGYIGIYPGQRSTTAYDANTGNSFATTLYTYLPNKYYSLFVVGANGTYKNIIANDPLDSLSGISGKSYIRYINAIPDSGKLMVTMNDGQSNVVNDNNVAFTTVSAFEPIDTGAVQVSIDNGGAIHVQRTITLEDRKTYTLLFTGNPTSGEMNDSIQIRYVENGTLKQDSTAQGLSKDSR